MAMMTTHPPSVVALIPARSGSKRIQNKNIRPLNGHPLLAYTISTARESGIFEDVLVSSDSLEYLNVGLEYGAKVTQRPSEYATDTSPDIEWVSNALYQLWHATGMTYDAFAILRPTSPFRTAETIRRAWRAFIGTQSHEQECGIYTQYFCTCPMYGVDSLRAIEKVKQHPGKMWKVVDGQSMFPVLSRSPGAIGLQPLHSIPTQLLPPIYVQNASLEIAWTKVVRETSTISGSRIMPFFTEGYEGYDLNTEEDWILAEALLERGLAKLPEVRTYAADSRI